MIQKLLKRLIAHPYPLLIFLLTVIIFSANYKPDTYLIGWDNLQTELNPLLALKRAVFSVWQEYQSFGLVASMAHAADIPHAFFIFILSFVLPQSLIRYFFHHLMLFIGGWGMFSLTRKLLGSKEKEIFGFAAALFYMLNFGTVQVFFLPFEAFSIFFGFLPWELLAFLIILEKKPKKKDYLFLFLINLVAMTQSYVQTIFIVYLIILGLITVGYSIETKNIKIAARALIAGIIIFTVNSVWILPQVYFLANRGQHIVEEAKINQLATEGVLYLNKEKATLAHFINMEGLYYDLFGMNKQPLFFAWHTHFNNPLVKLIPLFFLVISLVGIFRKRTYRLSFIICLIVFLFVLLNATPPFSYISDFCRKNNFINQIFRSPFTKFIIPYALVLSFFFASGLNMIADLIISFKKRISDDRNTLQIIAKATVLITVVLIIIYSLPSFQGHFFSAEMKIKIPKDYPHLFNYLKKQDKNKRIALLPEYTFWPWFFHRWGYNGSGFLWYGIEQPIISRTFDVWSSKSEGYFWEMKQTIESEDVVLFEKILTKYDVSYLIMDRSILPVATILKAIQYDRVDTMLKQSQRINLVKKWGKIELYAIKKTRPIQNYIAYADNLPHAGPTVQFTNKDTVYDRMGDYNTSPPFDIVYPFLDLMNQTRLTEKKWTLDETDKSFTLTAKLPVNTDDYIINTSYQQSKTSIFNADGLLFAKDRYVMTIKNNTMIITIPKIKAIEFISKNTTVENCSLTPWRGKNNTLLNEDKNSITITSTGGSLACFGYYAPFLEQKYGYLAKIENKNSEGKRLFLYILDMTKKQTYIEDIVKNDSEYFLLGQKYQFGSGYSIVFHNYSYANIPSTNQLIQLTIYLFPYNEIKNIFLTKKNTVITRSHFNNEFSSSKLNYFTYNAVIKQPIDNTMLILNQAYEKNWKAYIVKSSKSPAPLEKVKSLFVASLPFLFGKELNKHVLVNNWANGWKLESQKYTIIIIFLPQYLEFLGFGLVILSFIFIIKMKQNH